MAKQIDGREYLIIPTQEELAEAWGQFQDITRRRGERGQFTLREDGSAHVDGMVNAQQILADNEHLDAAITLTGTGLSKNLEAGRISAEDIYRLGARFILEMFSIATTDYDAKQITEGLDSPDET